jgi:uncharacterized membrane protein YebE (DUF533 family)
MSLVGTLAKVAIGVAAAKGLSHAFGQARQPSSMGMSPGQGGSMNSQMGGEGGLGSLLEQLTKGMGGGAGPAPGASASAPAEGGLDQLIKGLADAFSGGTAPKANTGSQTGSQQGQGSFADVLNQSFRRSGEPELAPTPPQNAAAGLMLRAMLQAAKCDGRIDDAEKQKILSALSDATPEEMAFVNRELSSPVDVQGLVRQVPKGMENQIYAASVMGIDLDSQAEAQYLGNLCSALGMGPQQANAIHAQLGVPARFSA